MTGGGRDKAPAHGYYTDMLCFVEIALMYLSFSKQSSYIILFRSVPLSKVTHTGIYKQRNVTEHNVYTLKSCNLQKSDWLDVLCFFQRMKVIACV